MFRSFCMSLVIFGISHLAEATSFPSKEFRFKVLNAGLIRELLTHPHFVIQEGRAVDEMSVDESRTICRVSVGNGMKSRQKIFPKFLTAYTRWDAPARDAVSIGFYFRERGLLLMCIKGSQIPFQIEDLDNKALKGILKYSGVVNRHRQKISRPLPNEKRILT